MIITHAPPDGFNLFGNVGVVSGTSMVFTRQFQQAFAPASFDPSTELCEEKTNDRLIREVDGDAGIRRPGG